jgi:ferredoxin-type protein NapF
LNGDPKELGDPARRDFLLGRIWRPSETTENLSLGPLPPCLDSATADAALACLDCDAPCVASCDEGIVFRHPGSHSLAGIAYLSFEEKGCTYCGDCRQACPACPEPDAEPPAIGLALLADSECMAWNGVVCRTCAFACPERAITMDPRGRPSLAAESCNGCGLCVPVCPSKALSIVF